ncbi:hypothetical protein PPL_00928 [Heterostelium album PN500]|uniref:Uncharacterized protein n=1 Tax=Heterostelium pallidum (strain ATCC 26659 / Pp 5 / PN500) TaxID=670386 RepID=D3AXM2_HETP5|nr:hypothetical protein PPL_00928 [Heterostelium album PN500]EFA85699.1 hypothetical protein PPL_00928 [Heterostelium album PN500]|eukprot:XP_020437805.1 hypothetical protein PPL_00928 [Heterostelium album PN500]
MNIKNISNSNSGSSSYNLDTFQHQQQNLKNNNSLLNNNINNIIQHNNNIVSFLGNRSAEHPQHLLSPILFSGAGLNNAKQTQMFQQEQTISTPMIPLDEEQEYSDNDYDMSPKDDITSPSKKRGRGPIHNGIRRSPNKWTKEENKRLFELVSQYGEKKWKRISAEMGGQKTGAQCAQHWKRVLSPDIRKGPWDEDEEELLLRLVNQHGSSWKKIAKRICKRTDIQCRYQYLKALQSREVPWIPKEDEAMLKKVQELDMNLSWLEVSEYLAKLKHTNTLRTALECKTRYMQLTNEIPMATQQAGGMPSSPISECNQYDSNSSSPTMESSELDSYTRRRNLPTSASSSSLLSSSSSKVTISNLMSPTSSPIQSPLSSPVFSNNNNPLCNNTMDINKNINNPLLYRSNSHSSIISASHPKNVSTSPSSKNFSINHLLDNSPTLQSINSSVDTYKSNNTEQPLCKKVRSNGEYYIQPTANTSTSLPSNALRLQSFGTGFNSDNSSDDDHFRSNSLINNPFLPKSSSSMLLPSTSMLAQGASSFGHHHHSSSRNPLSSSGSNYPNSSSSTPNNTSSPLSSPFSSPSRASPPTLSTIQKLKNTSFDFFNLESLAAVASSQPRETRPNNIDQLQLQVK